MLLETVNATITRVEKLLKDMEKEDNPICLEDHLTALLTGIEKGRVLPSLCDGKQQHSLISRLELEYSDPDIHYDIYQLIKYSYVRNYTQQHMDKVVSIWKHLLEPMLGVPTRPEESAHTLSNQGIERHRISDDSDGDKDWGVLGSEYSDGEEHSDEDVHDNNAKETDDGQDVEYCGLLPFTDCFLHKAKLVTKCMTQAFQRDNDSQLFYGNESFYVLFMLHCILYEGLQKAKFYSSSDSKKWRIGDDTDSADRYARFKSALYNLLDGSIEQEDYEKECLTILGPESYILFTLDKLMAIILFQLQGMAVRDVNNKLIQLYANESAKKPWTSMDNSNYIENVWRLLSDDNIFRLEYVPAAAQLSIQLSKPCVDEADKEGYDGDGDDRV